MNRIVKDGKEEKCIIMKKSHNNTVYNDLYKGTSSMWMEPEM